MTPQLIEAASHTFSTPTISAGSAVIFLVGFILGMIVRGRWGG